MGSKICCVLCGELKTTNGMTFNKNLKPVCKDCIVKNNIATVKYTPSIRITQEAYEENIKRKKIRIKEQK